VTGTAHNTSQQHQSSLVQGFSTIQHHQLKSSQNKEHQIQKGDDLQDEKDQMVTLIAQLEEKRLRKQI